MIDLDESREIIKQNIGIYFTDFNRTQKKMFISTYFVSSTGDIDKEDEPLFSVFTGLGFCRRFNAAIFL
jgi:hypothetical protein